MGLQKVLQEPKELNTISSTDTLCSTVAGSFGGGRCGKAVVLGRVKELQGRGTG